MFKLLGYDFDYQNATAFFYYQDKDGRNYRETAIFRKPRRDYDVELLDRALFLAFILIGASYYKAYPTRQVLLADPLDEFQARFFSMAYQEGLSQFAFENDLSRGDLASFVATPDYTPPAPIDYPGRGRIVLQSGGKDSLLTATLLAEKRQRFTPVYITSTGHYPKVLDELGAKLTLITRQIDLAALKQAGGKNGHVPVTYIIQTLALIQAILDNKNTVLTSIGQEGTEPTTTMGDLPINHQWSKSPEAEKLYNEYLRRYLASTLSVASPLRDYTELEIAEQFAKKCWDKYGGKFSSCNRANYGQGKENETLSWCGRCPKCANSYLLFAPFVPAARQQKLFGGKDLFTDSDLMKTFQGLLGYDGVPKPFECVATIAELRQAYAAKLPGYGEVKFLAVPEKRQ